MAEAALLTGLDHRSGLPRLIATEREADHVTLVLHRLKGPTLRDAYGPADRPLDYFRTAEFLLALRKLCITLRDLHRRGVGHRALSPDVIVMSDNGNVCLRDPGLATVDPEPGEGVAPYQAPEQLRTALGNWDAGRVDVYQVAAIAYHVLTGHPPAGPSLPPVSATDSRLPRLLDTVLAKALDHDAGRRPADAGRLAALLNSVLNDLRNGGRK
jgi:serine/threonine protein kinase